MLKYHYFIDKIRQNKFLWYTYDAWGNCTILSDTNTIAYTNPLRYRGYYFDSDTGLYYLQSRYYDPKIGRFINADEPGMLIFGVYNLFNYCYNNPLLNTDYSGKFSRAKSIYDSIRIDVMIVGGAFLKVKGYNISEMFLAEALYGDGKLSSSQQKKVIKKIKKDSNFKKYIIKKVCSLSKNTGSFGTEFNYEFKKGDLFYAIHWSKCFMTGSKKNNIWSIKIEVSDTFDFTEWWGLKDHGPLAALSNNLGCQLQSMGILNAFSWKVKYNIKIDAKKGTIV